MTKLQWWFAALLLACPAPSGGEDAEGSTSASTSDGSSSGGAVDRCVDVACGAGSACDPHDGRCYCEPGFHGDGEAGCAAHPDYCAMAEASVGHSVCDHEVPDEAAWVRLSTDGTGAKGLRRLGKYLAPLTAAAPLPTLFGDRVQYSLHICMLQEAFMDVLPGFTHADYLDLVYWRSKRTMIAGSVYEATSTELPVRFLFTVETPDMPGETASLEEVYTVYHLLRDRFAPGDLGFLPRSASQQGVALGWEDPGVAVVFNSGVSEPKPMQCE